MKNYWETVGDYMNRFEVPGGWIYKEREHMVFVPEPRLSPEYEEGYKDGYNDKVSQGDKVKPFDTTAAQFDAALNAALSAVDITVRPPNFRAFLAVALNALREGPK